MHPWERTPEICPDYFRIIPDYSGIIPDYFGLFRVIFLVGCVDSKNFMFWSGGIIPDYSGLFRIIPPPQFWCFHDGCVEIDM